jgi:hypothetical protein
VTSAENLASLNRLGVDAHQRMTTIKAMSRALLIKGVGIGDHVERVAPMTGLSATASGFALGKGWRLVAPCIAFTRRRFV